MSDCLIVVSEGRVKRVFTPNADDHFKILDLDWLRDNGVSNDAIEKLLQAAISMVDNASANMLTDHPLNFED